jgi:hypothetical protein
MGDRAPQNDRDDRVADPTSRDSYSGRYAAVLGGFDLLKREEVWSMSCDWLGVCRR